MCAFPKNFKHLNIVLYCNTIKIRNWKKAFRKFWKIRRAVFQIFGNSKIFKWMMPLYLTFFLANSFILAPGDVLIEKDNRENVFKCICFGHFQWTQVSPEFLWTTISSTKATRNCSPRRAKPPSRKTSSYLSSTTRSHKYTARTSRKGRLPSSVWEIS